MESLYNLGAGKIFKGFVFFSLIMILMLRAQAQSLSQYNWYFGNSVYAIKFNRATSVAKISSDKVTPFGTGGSAVATDPTNADLLFYTDGTNVYDATNTLMINGNALTSTPNSSANQPVTICPVPNDSTKYFIFSNTANYTTGGTISVSVVDLNLFGNSNYPNPPLGEVIAGAKNLATGLSGTSEGMIVIPHKNGKDYWLITHQNGTANYHASKITQTSFNATAKTFSFVSDSITSVGLPLSVANFAFNAKKNLLAVSPQIANTNAVIYNFSNGLLSPNQEILNSGYASTSNQEIYDMEWSNSGQYLYLSRAGDATTNADVLQYDLTNSTISLASVLKNAEYRSYGLQYAPDSAIYHLYQATSGGPFLVEKFTSTDSVASAVVETALPLGANDFNGTQFPSFSPRTKINLQLSFTYTQPTCQNNNVTFFPNVYPNADSLHWDFGDTTSVTAWSPVHQYKSSGTDTVKLIAYYAGQTDTVKQVINVTAFTLQLQLVSDTTACSCQLPVNKLTCSLPQFSVTAKTSGGSGTPTFLWSDNITTTATFKPDSAGYYYVVASDGSGCSTYAGVNVKEYEKPDQRENIWYFGNKAGIDFNQTPPKALNKSAMDAPAGCAITCDRNGQVVFYTDGNQVWNRKNESIATGIGGDPNSSQSALIVSVPGDETLYYIFTTQAINGTSQNRLSYSLFDLKMNGGYGGIVQQNVLLFEKSTERITASEQWLIAHEFGNSTFRAYSISAQGIGDPVYSAIGSVHSSQDALNGEGYMKLSPNNILAVALASSSPVSNLVELFDFNATTGELSNYRKINLNNTNGQVYGIEFSPSGNKVFASVMGTPTSYIYEYSIDSLGNPHLKQDVSENATIGAIQIAPDNQIYFAINGSSKLGTILANPDTAQVSTINMNGFTLASGTTSNIGLPNFRQQQSDGFGTPGFTYTNACVGDSTFFVGTPTDPIDKFQWYFGDGSGSTDSSPKHLYTSAGTYTVTMILTNRCGLDSTFVHKVVVNAPPAKPFSSLTATLCTTPITLNANSANAPNLTYAWSTGDSTRTISVSQAATISVVDTDTTTGCSTSGTIKIVDGRPKVNLGPDQTICQNVTVANLDAQNPNDTYTWTITNVTTHTSTIGGTTQTQAVSTSVIGKYKYKVVVTDAVVGCSIADSVTFTINQMPTLNIAGTDPTSCTATDGTVSLSAITSANLYSYSVFGSSSVANGTDQSAGTQGPFNGLAAGTYSATITDQISGCSISKSVGLTSGSFTVTPAVATTHCDPPKIKITVTGGGTAPFQYAVTNSSTSKIISSTSSSTTNTITVPPQGSGTTVVYVVQVTDNNGCVVSNNLPVTTLMPTPLTITANLCANPATLVASNGTTYTWTTPSGSTSPNNPLAVNQSGKYKVTSTSSGCAVSDSTTIVYNGVLNPSFTQTDACQTQAVLTASPSGNYTYRWYENGATSPTKIGQQITITTADDNASFVLEVVDAQSGCSIQSASKTVSVVGDLIVLLNSTLACDDGKAFTLTASTNATTPTYTWFLNGNLITGARDFTLQQTSAGIYKVDVSLPNCKDSASVQIIKAPLPQGFLNSGYYICNDPQFPNLSTTATLNPGVFNSYSWFKNNVSLSYTSQTYTASEQGQYTVSITNSIGCSNTVSTNVVNDCEPIVTGPNAFRPGSTHNENSYFHLFTFFITNFEIIIYNRWGEPIFESKDENFKWNGGFNNNASQPVQGDTYAYVVRYVSSFHPEQGIKEYRGGVVLLR